MFHLQDAIKLHMNGRDFRQLELSHNPAEYVNINLVLANLGSSNQYDKIRDAAREMAQLEVKIPSIDKKSGKQLVPYPSFHISPYR